MREEGIGRMPSLHQLATRKHTAACMLGWILVAVVVLAPAETTAQSDLPGLRPVPPSAFGFRIPAGEVRPGNRRAVATLDQDGEPVIGQAYVHVGDHVIVLLPSGRLVSRKSVDAPPTERPFRPASTAQLTRQLTVGPLEGFQVSQSARYLFIYNTSDAFAATTQRIIETMFRGVVLHARAQKIKVRDPDVPLVVIMFRTEAEFQRYRRMPAGVVAYYDVLSNHVVLYEQSRSRRVDRELALQQSLSTIAHEGAHQILHNIGVQQRLSVWPMWLSEGLAEYFAPTKLAKDFRWKGAGQINDLRMYELENYFLGQAQRPDGATLRQTVQARQLTSTGYASAWSLTHFLAKRHRTDFNRFVNRLSTVQPLQGFIGSPDSPLVPDNLKLFQQQFGEDLAELEDKLIGHLKRQPYISPYARHPHYVVMVTYYEGRRPQKQARFFHLRSMARRWQRQVLESLPDEARSEAETGVREFANRSEADRFTRQWLANRP